MSAKWHAEKISFEDIHNLRKKAEDLRREAELAEREGNLEKVARIVYGELPAAEKEFKAYEKKYLGVKPKTKNGKKIRRTIH